MLDANPETPENDNNSDKYRCQTFTVTQLAATWGVTPSTLYELHHRGELTIVKIGRKSVIFKDEIEAFRKRNAMSRGADRSRAVGRFSPTKKINGA